MKRALVLVCSGLLLIGIGLFTACDTSGGGGNDFNASQGVTVNWTGVYFGQLGGGLAVGAAIKGNITRLVISQGGNAIEVVDDKGNKYTGSVGAPGLIANPNEDGSFSANAELVQAQVTWSGKDAVAERDVEFVGVFHIVSVTDIDGVSDVTTDTSTDTDSSNSESSTNKTTTTTINIPPIEDVTTVTINDGTGETSEDSVVQTITTTREFTITEANSQFRLQGTWVEAGGAVAQVDAISPGGIATITTTETTTTDDATTGSGT